jgi:poly(A) polymerase
VAYFAGGCVRDLVLGMEPADWDIATDAPPGRVRELFSRTQAVGAAFGVILVKHGRSTIEVATFRAEGVYADGRRPTEVRFTSAEEDARRRDFTINGLFLDPIEDRVIDYVGGQQDLAGRVIRAIGDPSERFAEDHLRLLRAVRFAARFGFAIEPVTRQAILRYAPKLPRISPERIADELRRMLTPVSRAEAMALLDELGLTEQLHRHLPLPVQDGPRPPQAAEVVALNPNPAEPIGFPLGLATSIIRFAATRGVDPRALLEVKSIQAAVRACRKSLRISNEESAALEELLNLDHLLQGPEPTVAQLKRFLAQGTAGDSRALLRALAAMQVAPGRVGWLEGQFQQLSQQEVAPVPLITGDDLVAAGYSPGPTFKRVLDAVYDAQLEARVHDRAQAMDLARRLLDRRNG